MFTDIYIKKLVMEGFKGYKEKTELNFSEITKIIADNEKGKTTIGEAITWAYLGSNLFGNDKVDSDFLNEDSKNMKVTIEFISQDKEYTLTRNRIGSTTTIYLNNKVIKQTELTSMLGNKNIFLSIFNPEYFNSMNYNDGRDFLITILPDIEKEDIIAKIDSFSIEYIKDDLELIHNNPNLYIQSKRAEIKTLEDDLLFNEGALSNLNLSETTSKVVIFDSRTLEVLEEELDKISLTKVEPDTKDYEKLVEDKNSLEKEIISINAREFTKVETIEEMKELAALEKNISITEMEKYEVSEEAKSQIVSLEAQYLSLREEYKKHQITPLNEGDRCPKCKTKVNHTHAEMLKDDLISELNQLEIQGKEKASELAQYKKGIELKEKDFNDVKSMKLKEFKEKHQTLTEHIRKIEESNKTNQSLFLEKKEKSITTLKAKLKQIEEKMSLIKSSYQEKEEIRLKEINNRKEELKKEILELRKEKAQIDAHNLKIKIQEEEFEKNTEKRNKLLEENTNINANITIFKSQVEISKEYTNIKVKLLSEEIHSHLKDVKIKLQKVVKSTGEVKDCFDIFYKDKKYDIASRSGKIKIGLELSNLIRNLTGYNYPLFVDNAESITKYEVPEGVQLIETKVAEGEEIKIVVSENHKQLSLAI